MRCVAGPAQWAWLKRLLMISHALWPGLADKHSRQFTDQILFWELRSWLFNDTRTHDG
jgi:hypothetical protein